MKNSERIILLDLLKLAVLAAIQILHAQEFTFYADEVHLPGSLFDSTLQYYARFFSLGGQILVAIIFLLLGYSGKDRREILKVCAFCLIGAVVLSILQSDLGELHLEWDIYSYLLLTGLFVSVLPRGNLFVILLCAALLMIDPETWKKLFFQNTFFAVLTGTQSEFSTGAWAPLPWTFYGVLFFNTGHLIRQKVLNWFVLTKRETALWVILLCVSAPFFGAYFRTPVGPGYYRHTFHEPMLLFWGNILPFLFLIRISFLESVQNRLRGLPIVTLCSRSVWVRSLGLSYLVALIYVGVLCEYEDTYRSHPWLFDVFVISIMPVTEGILRLSFLAKKNLTSPDIS